MRLTLIAGVFILQVLAHGAAQGDDGWKETLMGYDDEKVSELITSMRESGTPTVQQLLNAFDEATQGKGERQLPSGSTTYYLHNNVMHMLGALRASEARTLCLKVLDPSNKYHPTAGYMATRTLGLTGKREDIDFLSELKASFHPSRKKFKRNCTVAIEMLEATDPCLVLLKVVEERGESARRATMLLGDLRYQGAVDTLVGALQNGNAPVFTIRALRSITGQSFGWRRGGRAENEVAIRLWIRWWKRNQRLSPEVSKGIPDLIEQLGSKDDKVKTSAQARLREIGPSVVPILRKYLEELSPASAGIKGLLLELDDAYALEEVVRSGPRADRAKAIKQLGAMRSLSSIPVLVEAIDSPNRKTRLAALTALLKLEKTTLEDAILKGLSDFLESKNLDERSQCIFFLERMKSKNARKALLSLLDDPSSSVRQEAAYAFADTKWKGASKKLMHLVAEDPSHMVRSLAAYSLGEIGQPACIGTLQNAIMDKNSSVRKRAAEALGKFYDDGSVPILIELLGDTDRNVVFAAVAALGNQQDSRAVSHLIPLLGHSTKKIRFAAGQSLLTLTQRAIPFDQLTTQADGQKLRHEWSVWWKENPLLPQGN